MNVVIYTHDMEPITIIDLPLHYLELACKHRRVFIAARPPTSVENLKSTDSVFKYEDTRTVELEFNKLKTNFHGKITESWIVTTHDEEFALLLRPGWLPGQRGAINDYQRTIDTLSKTIIAFLKNNIRD